MTSERQAAYLRRMYARRYAASRRQCDCLGPSPMEGGCDTPTCEGFTPACTCDEPSSIREALGLPDVSTTTTKDPAEPAYTPPPGFPF